MKIKQLGILSGVALAATLGTAGAAQAALVVVPTGLAPGDQYRLVFVTAGTRDATSTDINDYNTFVTNEATGGTPGIDTALDTALDAAGFDPNTITWKAIGSTASVAARDNTGTNPSSTGVPIYLIDGNRVANNNADLWDASILTAINKTPTLAAPPVDGVVWTGTNTNGTKSIFTELGALVQTIQGYYSSIDYGWITVSPENPSDTKALYGLSSVLTVPGNQPPAPVTVPESSSLLGFITLGGLMLGGAVRKARK